MKMHINLLLLLLLKNLTQDVAASTMSKPPEITVFVLCFAGVRACDVWVCTVQCMCVCVCVRQRSTFDVIN